MNNFIYILINAHSGNQDKEILTEKIAAHFQNAGRQVEIVPLDASTDIQRTCSDIVLKAKAEDALVVAVGGDGTINTIAGLCYTHHVVMGVIPLGTFNYFARDMGMETVEQALDAITDGTVVKVAAGFIQEHIFLNNAGIGIYTNIIRNREQVKSLLGRMQVVAFFSAVFTLVKGQKPFILKMNVEGKELIRKTNLVYVGNNMLQLKNLGFDVQERDFQRKLAFVIMKPVSKIYLLRLLVRGWLKTLSNDEKLEEFYVSEVHINSKRNHIHAVIDGEIIECTLPLTFRVDHSALRVVVPHAKAASLA